MKKIIASFVVTGLLLTNPIVSNAALGEQTLKSGMRHSDVKELEQVLEDKGYFTNKPNNKFGNDTKKAVIKTQKEHDIKANGIVGKSTYKALGINAPKVKMASVEEESTNLADQLVKEAKKYLGVPYAWGGSSPNGFDCSGFLNYVFDKGSDINLPRTVSEIYKEGTKVSKPEVGDIVFFETYKPGASHAGIYIGNDQFIHSSSSKGVSITSMDNSYWSKRYLGAKSI